MRDRCSEASRSPCVDRRDRRLILLLTGLYLILTLVNLGTLRFPQSVWTARSGRAVTVDLGETKHVTGIWFNGNIAVGNLLITSEGGQSLDFSQQYGEMFSWRKKSVDFYTRTVSLCLVNGNVALNEIAFLGEDGELLAGTVSNAEDAALMDEQDTVPREATYFNGMYFDEIYHARTAYEFLHGMPAYEWTHPPLGKLLIAVGVAVFGMTPFGWRFVPAVLGAAMLPIFYILGKRIFRRRDYALLAAGLFALDTLHFAQTRISTVDVFIVFFILLMYLFMLDFLRQDYLAAPLKKLWLPLGACGVSFGLGVASKWTGLYAGVGLAVLFFAHLIRVGTEKKRTPKERAVYRSRTIKTLLFCVVFFLVIPGLIYFLSYIPFYRYESSRHPEQIYGFKEALQTLIQQQKSMYGYHSKLEATHLCQSAWYEWPFSVRSVWFYFGIRTNGKVSNISSFGNPAVWWLSAVGVICLAVEWVFGRLRNPSREDRQSMAVLFLAIAANLFPWMLVTRCTFLYHYFPTLPFSILAAVFLLRHLEERGEIPAWVKWAWLGLAGVYFLLLLPAASGIPMPRLYAQFLEYVLPSGVLFHGAV